MPDIKDTLALRKSTHGSFRLNAEASQTLKTTIEVHRSKSLTTYHREALHAICAKIARIITGDPDHADSWHDIAGYATLVENIILEERGPKSNDAAK